VTDGSIVLPPEDTTIQKFTSTLSSNPSVDISTTKQQLGTLLQELESKVCHPISPTVWEVSVLMFTPVCGKLGSLTLGILALVNALIQVFFCFVVTFGFQFDTPSAQDVATWRETVAHDVKNADPMTSRSLARRVCDNDDTLHFSNVHKDLYHDLKKYTQGGDVVPHMGAILCCVVILCWLLHVTGELTSCLSFSKALLSLERGQTHILVRVAWGKKEFHFESISFVRLASTLLLTFFRACIACW